MMYLGIDGGIKGAMVLIDSDAAILGSWKMPLNAVKKVDPILILKLLGVIEQFSFDRMEDIRVGVERLLSLPSDTNEVGMAVDGLYRAKTPADREGFYDRIKRALKKTDGRVGTMTMGINWGYVVAAIVAKGWRYDTWSPRTWQAEMHRGVDAPRSTAKQRSALVASRLWPDEDWRFERMRKPHDGKIDAALIAEYTRRQYVSSR